MERVLHILLTIGSVEIEESAFEDEDEATLLATIRFPDDSLLYVSLTVNEVEGVPSLKRYSFHYMAAGGATIFRYDNSSHHQGLPHFPHHKHEGADERVIGCPQPSLRDIRDEIAAHLRA